MTPVESRALDYVVDFHSRAGLSPTYDEIASHLGVRSRSHAHRIIEQLISQGLLCKLNSRPRGIAPVNAPNLRAATTEALQAELARRGVTLGALSRGDQAVIGRGSHSCAMEGCFVSVRPGHAFCLSHWRMISPATQSELLAAHGTARRARRDSHAIARFQDAFTRCKLEIERGEGLR